MTTLIKCICKVPDQDRRYGEGVRIHNKINRPLKHNGNWRCTGCGREKQ